MKGSPNPAARLSPYLPDIEAFQAQAGELGIRPEVDRAGSRCHILMNRPGAAQAAAAQ